MNGSPRFFRYLPRHPDEAEWGAAVLDAGHGTVPPDTDYPLSDHPDDHFFTWEKGRRLAAYTFVYITRGKGEFDSKPSGKIAIEAGSVFLIFPHIWHRFRPQRESGWDEYWVECSGDLLEAAVKRSGLVPESPVLRVGHDDGLLRCFLNIADTIRQESPGFEAIIAMRALEIVARIRSLLKIAASEGTTVAEKFVKQSQLRMREAIADKIDFKQLASQLGMSYSSFRRQFKEETGRAPGEYFIEMKMNRAKELLMTDHSIQEIAGILGYDSLFYFSRHFKSCTGLSPTAYRSR